MSVAPGSAKLTSWTVTRAGGSHSSSPLFPAQYSARFHHRRVWPTIPPIMSIRVLHVVESLVPEAGSVAVSLPGLWTALQPHGIASVTVSLDRNATLPDGVTHTVFDPHETVRLVRDAGVVHFHGWGTDLGRRLATAARKVGRPYVVSPLGSLSEGPNCKRSWRARLRRLLGGNRLISQAALVTVLNTKERQSLQAAGLDRKIRVLAYGLTIDDYDGTADEGNVELPPASGGRSLLLLGPIHPVEGLVPFMKAFAEIGPDGDGWNLVLAGPETGDWRKMIEAAVRRKGGTDRVRFAPAAEVRTQRAWLARASLLAAPGLHYRPATSIMQAVAASVAVIASDRVTPDGLDGGVYVCAPTREALRETLRFALRLSDNQRADQARQAREAMRALFDWPVLAEHYARLYRELA